MITFSKTRKPTVLQLMELYRSAPWAVRRRAGRIARMMDKLDLGFCAFEGRSLVGFCRVSTDFSFRAVLWDVIVNPRFRRRGIGKKLVSLALGDPRLRSVDQFWLYTTDQQAFYRDLGFRLYPRHVMLLKKPFRRGRPG
jgi:ribosomal protein S18 acetylase RimI-like enzyme